MVACVKHKATSMRAKLQDDTHCRVLCLLQKDPEMSQRELAAAVGDSVGGMYHLLVSLIDKRLVKLVDFIAAEGKRRYTYVMTPKRSAWKVLFANHFLANKNGRIRGSQV